MSGDGFLSRWSRRKQEVAREDEEMRERPVDPAAGSPPAVVVEAIEPHDPEPDDPEAITPEELAALPSVEEITDPADFSQYLRKGVPAILRNAAMRRMWMLDPAIRDYVDPALDYAYDWNIPGGVPGNGPLVAGFDAKGEAEKFFSTMRGRISNETGEFEMADLEQSGSGDILSRSNDAAASPLSEGSNQDVLDGVSQEEKSSQGSASKTSAVDATLVVAEDPPPPSAGEERHAAQGPPRRHGRALPV
jgi:hypothetical protein